MKIGINNIFTTFWFLLMFLCGGTLTYISFTRSIFTSDILFIAKIFVGLLAIIIIGILFYFLYKFRILLINKNEIVSFYPFWLKKEKIDLTKIKNLKLENWTDQRGTVYRKISLRDSNSILSFTDREFENFESLTTEIPNCENKRKNIDFKQAKSNLSNMNFNIYMISGFLIFLTFNTIWNSGFHFIIFVFFLCSGILLLASIKRKLKYKKVINSIHN